MKLLLASKSEARRRMLEAAGVPFGLIDADLDEDAAKGELAHLPARDLAVALAERKALAATTGEPALILGADQTLELEDGSMLSKPTSRDEAQRHLQRLSGGTHQLHSAAVLAEQGRPVWQCVESVRLSVRPLTDMFITAYLDEEYEAIRWSVGCYRIEGPGSQLFEAIEGSHFAILGLPLLPLLSFLRERGVLAS